MKTGSRQEATDNSKRAKALSFALFTLLLALCFPAEAQQPAGKVFRIGLVTQGSGTGPGSVRADALRQGLRELGWIEGNNIMIEHRQSGGKADRSPALAGEMVRLKVDVIVWSGGVQGAKQIKTIPVVYVATTDLVSTGLVESLARPGGNITGLSSLARELSGKRLELLKETFPKVSRVAFLFNPGDPPNTIELEQLRGPAAALGLTLRAVEARGPDQIEPAFSMMIRERAEGLFTASGSVTNTNSRRIVELAARNRLPAVYHTSQFVDQGGLMSYGPNLADMFRRAAVYVDKILKGAKPAELPVEQPTKFEFVINLKTAKQIGLTIPPNVLARADKVIK
jgi:putative tryptophan/tyrosine transport system substrate-binding protein